MKSLLLRRIFYQHSLLWKHASPILKMLGEIPKSLEVHYAIYDVGSSQTIHLVLFASILDESHFKPETFIQLIRWFQRFT